MFDLVSVSYYPLGTTVLHVCIHLDTQLHIIQDNHSNGSVCVCVCVCVCVGAQKVSHNKDQLNTMTMSCNTLYKKLQAHIRCLFPSN